MEISSLLLWISGLCAGMGIGIIIERFLATFFDRQRKF